MSEQKMEQETNLLTQVREKDKELANLRTELENRSEDVNSLKSNLKAREESLRVAKQSEQHNAQQIGKLQNKLLSAHEKLNSMNEEKSTVASSYEDSIDKLKKQMAELEEGIVERDEFIEDLSQKEIESMKTMANVRSDLIKVEAKNLELANAIEERDSEIMRLIKTHGELDTRIKDLQEKEKKLNEREEQVEADNNRIDELFKQRDEIEMKKRAFKQRESQLQEVQKQIISQKRDIDEVIMREQKVSEKEVKLNRRDIAIKRIEDKQREQIGLHMKSKFSWSALISLSQVFVTNSMQFKTFESQ